MGLPSVQKAIVVIGPREAKLISDRPIPALRDHHILVKVVCVALNPADWKHIDHLSAPGAIPGCDYSGIVEEIGKGVTRFTKGDHICGVVHGGNALQLEDGAFAEYIVVKENLQIHMPKHLSFQQAATLGVGITTVGLSLYHNLKLELPTDTIVHPVSILIYGGSSATGSLAIQFAKLSGYLVFTTCSPHNFDFVKSLGADMVCDYRDPRAAEEIRKLTGDKLKIVLDTISLESSAKFCAEAMSTEGGVYTSLLPVTAPRSDIKSDLVLGYTTFGEPFVFGPQSFDAVPEDEAFSAWWWLLAEKYLGDGKIKVHPQSVRDGGLEGVLEGLDLMRKDQVSGQKLVYNVSEAP
ncbi:chaperonin 10-like protein [Penicillium frequentans]|uniref:Chaperonin 10-like protein n=1 Tax=Penicillium frequentans TaxID=3151616 RepID=A0AAD6CYZ9_9EURO|nr:chaperonin 10-like protein [Penicillium glabrum]